MARNAWSWGVLLLCVLANVWCSSASEPYGDDGHCVWYDECGQDPDYPPDFLGHTLNCAYSGPAKPIQQPMFEILKDVCPHLIPEDASMPDLCCSERQLKTLQKDFELPQALINGSCPTCYYNLRKNFCDMTCHPRQSRFLVPWIIKANNSDFETVDMVKSITYYVHNQFNTETYDSCKNVQVPEMSDTIMGFLCGRWGSAQCDPQKWFNFMGSVSNGYAAFEVTYFYGSGELMDGLTFHNPPIVPCNQPPPLYPGQPANETKSSCGCDDCPVACTSSTFSSSSTMPTSSTIPSSKEAMCANTFSVVVQLILYTLTVY